MLEALLLERGNKTAAGNSHSQYLEPPTYIVVESIDIQ